MKAYFAKHHLADGRNALEAFEQDNAMRIRRRLEQTENAIDSVLTDKERMADKFQKN